MVLSRKDAYGQEIWAYLNGERGFSEIVERDDNFIDRSSGPETYFQKFVDWHDVDKRAMLEVRGKRVLDVGCGAGRVCLNLQQEGYEVVGIDNSPFAIKTCLRMGVKDARLLPIEDIGTLPPNSYDTIIMLGNNFGLFGDFEKARRLLRRMYELTSDYGVIIAESTDPYKTKIKDHFEYHKLNKRRKRMPGQLRIRVRFRKVIGEWFDYLLVSRDEMEKIVKGTGWKIVKILNKPKSASYIAIIVKDN